MKKLLLLFILVFPLVDCLSQDWIEVTQTSSGNQIFIADKYIKKGGTFGNDEGVYRIWTKTVLKKYEQKKYGKTKIYQNAVLKSLNDYDCINQKTRLIMSILYDSNGNVIQSSDTDEYGMDWNFVIPETVGEAIFRLACKLSNED
ncbi:surface-adhesin E family protein [Flavobacterium sp. GCM10027622]|uniref:surface-adhesin E family protein n=1 Tax=unclassified Flavobacterium TaxID=196869 RepID=UPI0036184AB3